MRKILLVSLAFIVCFYSLKSNVVIPDSAIRLRIISNSNTIYDQNVKTRVKNRVESELYTTLKDEKSKEGARNIIKSNIPNLENVIKDELKDENYSYKIDYGMHFFPKKEYKGVVYKEGEYESLLITLGKGQGDNFWCVLFPPLCVMEEDETKDVEYKWFIKDVLEKYF